MKTLLILRGLPGAGKSTLASALGGIVCTADDYHELNGGFSISNLKKSHAWCLDKARNAMESGEALVIVANTSTGAWEFSGYIAEAAKNGYMVHTVIVENRHGSKSVHGVPSSKVAEMRQRFEITL